MIHIFICHLRLCIISFDDYEIYKKGQKKQLDSSGLDLQFPIKI